MPNDEHEFDRAIRHLENNERRSRRRVLLVTIVPTVLAALLISAIAIIVWRQIAQAHQLRQSEKRLDEDRTNIGIAASSIAAQTAGRRLAPDPSNPPQPLTLDETVEIGKSVDRATLDRPLENTQALWVDDNPDNNILERQALSALGMQFELALDTGEALQILDGKQFSVIITDFGRKGDKQAGYTLLDAVKKHRNAAPVIIYTINSDPKYESQAIGHGAYGQTDCPRKLLDLVVAATQKRDE